MIIAEYTNHIGQDVVIEKDENGVYHIGYNGRITQSGDADLVIRWFANAMESASSTIVRLQQQ